MAAIEKTEAPARKQPLDRDVSSLGNSFMFPPRVIADIHIKSGNTPNPNSDLISSNRTWPSAVIKPIR